MSDLTLRELRRKWQASGDVVDRLAFARAAERLETADTLRRDAVFSECMVYRYTLERVWNDELPEILFVLLNPSVATAEVDDPTNRRGMGFARAWGFGACTFVNLFAFRSPHPRVMKAYPKPVGSHNDLWIIRCAMRAKKIVVAWGTHGIHKTRDQEVLELLHPFDVFCLGTTKNGHPKHPLYLAKTTPLVPFDNPFRADS